MASSTIALSRGVVAAKFEPAASHVAADMLGINTFLNLLLHPDMREAREKHITLHGVDGEVLAAFIRFLYTCNCSIVPEKLVGLCAMADQYDVTLLQQLCMDAIRMHAPNHRYCACSTV